MKQRSFFQTKAGKLTIEFLMIIAAFILIMTGLYIQNTFLSGIGFAAIGAAMLYSPIMVCVLNCRKRK